MKETRVVETDAPMTKIHEHQAVWMTKDEPDADVDAVSAQVSIEYQPTGVVVTEEYVKSLLPSLLALGDKPGADYPVPEVVATRLYRTLRTDLDTDRLLVTIDYEIGEYHLVKGITDEFPNTVSVGGFQ